MYKNYDLHKSRIIEMLINLPFENKEFYADYLAQTYYYVNHSERLLALAASRMENSDRQMQRRFFAHLGEENAHDLMVKKDLENLGYKIEQFPERVQTKMFWETQYYKVEHVDPSALMGYILFLEDVATHVCTPMFNKITPIHGRTCATFLRVHGEEDPGHVADAFKVIDSLSAERKAIVIKNLEQSSVAYMEMITSLLKDHNLL